jgi:hypothetical protein
MPFKSKSQARWMFSAEKRGDVKKGEAEKWAHETPNMKYLPEKVKKGKTKGKGRMTKTSGMSGNLVGR